MSRRARNRASRNSTNEAGNSKRSCEDDDRGQSSSLYFCMYLLLALSLLGGVVVAASVTAFSINDEHTSIDAAPFFNDISSSFENCPSSTNATRVDYVNSSKDHILGEPSVPSIQGELYQSNFPPGAVLLLIY